MKAVTDEVETLLDGLEEASLRSGALLASELIAQVVGRDPGIRRRARRADDPRPGGRRADGGHRAGRTVVSSDHESEPDPLADWGSFILDRLADRWGIDVPAQRSIWAEIRRPAPAFG